MLQARATPTTTRPPSGSSVPCLDDAWGELSHLEDTYPGFRAWFWGKVSLGVAGGTRRLFTLHDTRSIHGIVIAKRTDDERKLCTVWVAENARRRGVASALIDEACDWLAAARPLITVPEERMPELGPLLGRRGFVHTASLPSFYRPGRTEHVFNGQLVRRAYC